MVNNDMEIPSSVQVLSMEIPRFLFSFSGAFCLVLRTTPPGSGATVRPESRSPALQRTRGRRRGKQRAMRPRQGKSGVCAGKLPFA